MRHGNWLVFALGYATTGAAAGQCEVWQLSAPGTGAFGISADASGDRVMIGAFHEDPAGAAYVFDAATGGQLAKLTPSDVTDPSDWNAFGYDVALDAGRALVAAKTDDDFGNYSGAVYVFDSTSGQELFKLHASDGKAWDEFGSSLAARGGQALVGARYHDDRGAAYVFDVATGTETARLLASDGAADDEFGASVDVFGDLAIVGASGKGNGTGAAYVYDVSTGQQIWKLTASDGGPNDRFGFSVALGEDLALVGAPGHDGDSGAVYLYDTSTGLELVEFAGVGEYGWSMAMSDGRALVTSFDSSWVHVLDLDRLVETGQFTEPDSGFGWSLAMDGGLAVVGAPFSNFRGTAFVYSFPVTVGTSYCGPANLKSTGTSGTVSAIGGGFIACPHQLVASQLPPQQSGYFLASATQGFVPFPPGSQGNLCLRGAVGRFREQVRNSGTEGSFAIDLDLAAFPPPLPAIVQPGDTWNFQAWFRDMNPGATSNFTDGVSVTFR